MMRRGKKVSRRQLKEILDANFGNKICFLKIVRWNILVVFIVLLTQHPGRYTLTSQQERHKIIKVQEPSKMKRLVKNMIGIIKKSDILTNKISKSFNNKY